MDSFAAPHWAETWNKSLWWKLIGINGTKANPYPKDFCTFWRHTFVNSVLCFMAISFISMLVFYTFVMILIGIYLYQSDFLIFIGGMILIVAAIGVISYIVAKLKDTEFVYYLALGLYYLIGVPVKYTIVIPVAYMFNKLVLVIGSVLSKFKIKSKSKSDNPTIVIQYYRSLKEKYCPMMEYK